MARVRNWYNQSKSATLIWFVSLITFYAVFRMASKLSPSSRDIPVSNAERLRLYDKMTRDLDEHGALFLKQGETSQSLSLSDLFDVKNGSVTPVLKAADPPVRANVLYLSPEYSLPISKAVRDIFSPSLDKVIWFQNSELYHFSMVHASHHIVPIPASEEEIEAEANAVKAVADKLCPMTIVLDRAVLTSTGVLLGCWQVISGTDPATIRSKLRNALPRAPGKQLVRTSTDYQTLSFKFSYENSNDMQSFKLQTFLPLASQNGEKKEKSMTLPYFIRHLQGFLVTLKIHPRNQALLQNCITFMN